MIRAKTRIREKPVLNARVSALAAALIVLFAQAGMGASRSYIATKTGSGAAWIAVLAVIVFIAALVGVILYLERVRSKKIEALAQSLGLSFRRKPTGADNTLPAGSYLANEGHGRLVSNVLEAARSDELNFTLFDYQYTIGYGKSSSTQHQTVTKMQSDLFQLPRFILFPETFFARMGKMFGTSDINFPESPEFSRKFVLRGEDEAAIRGLFNPALRQALESHDRVTIEGAGELLFIFRAGRRAKPEELPVKIDQDKRIAALFFEAQEAMASGGVRTGAGQPPPLPSQ